MHAVEFTMGLTLVDVLRFVAAQHANSLPITDNNDDANSSTEDDDIPEMLMDYLPLLKDINLRTDITLAFEQWMKSGAVSADDFFNSDSHASDSNHSSSSSEYTKSLIRKLSLFSDLAVRKLPATHPDCFQMHTHTIASLLEQSSHSLQQRYTRSLRTRRRR